MLADSSKTLFWYALKCLQISIKSIVSVLRRSVAFFENARAINGNFAAGILFLEKGFVE